MSDITSPECPLSKCSEKEIGTPALKGEGIVKVLRVGGLCPTCQDDRLDYDGMLNLACPNCGAVVNTGGAFT